MSSSMALDSLTISVPATSGLSGREASARIEARVEVLALLVRRGVFVARRRDGRTVEAGFRARPDGLDGARRTRPRSCAERTGRVYRRRRAMVAAGAAGRRSIRRAVGGRGRLLDAFSRRRRGLRPARSNSRHANRRRHRVAQRQTPVNAEFLRRMADLAAAKMAADQDVEQLEGEVEKLSVHLGSTFEEISLLYRLTQNLKLSSNDEELRPARTGVAGGGRAGRRAGAAIHAARRSGSDHSRLAL